MASTAAAHAGVRRHRTPSSRRLIPRALDVAARRWLKEHRRRRARVAGPCRARRGRIRLRLFVRRVPPVHASPVRGRERGQTSRLPRPLRPGRCRTTGGKRGALERVPELCQLRLGQRCCVRGSPIPGEHLEDRRLGLRYPTLRRRSQEPQEVRDSLSAVSVQRHIRQDAAERSVLPPARTIGRPR